MARGIPLSGEERLSRLRIKKQNIETQIGFFQSCLERTKAMIEELEQEQLNENE